MSGGGEASSGEEKEKGAWEAVSIVTVGMSLASAVTTLASTQCAASSSQQPVDDPAGAATSSSCGTYGSFTYSSVASLVSAVLQGGGHGPRRVGLPRHAVNVIGRKVMKHKKTSRVIIPHRWGGFAPPIDEKPANEDEQRPPPPCSPPSCSSSYSCPTVATAPCCCENRDPCDAWTS